MSLQQAMDAAKNAASNVPAVQEPQGNNDLAPTNLSTGLDDFLSGGMQVDAWIQLKDGGIRLDRNDKNFITEFNAELDLNSVQFFHGIRAEMGGSAQYAKTFDGGKTTNRGENWASTYNYFKENGVKFSDTYRGADMVLVLTEDVVQGKATIPAGTRLGYTTPITGFAPFQNLLKKLAAEGKVSEAGGGRLSGPTVAVKAYHEMGTSKGGQDYGILHLDLVD